MGKLFPHLVGVFCTHLEPPHMMPKIQVCRVGQYQEYFQVFSYIAYIFLELGGSAAEAAAVK